MTQDEKQRLLGKVKRYTDLMRGDAKNAMLAAKQLVDADPNGEDSNVGGIKWAIEEIQKRLQDIEDNLGG